MNESTDITSVGRQWIFRNVLFRRISLVLLMVLVGRVMVSHATASPQVDYCKKDAQVVDKSWERFDVEEFSFWYKRTGADALSRLTDSDANSVPDVIQDAALQAITFRRVLTESGFKHPLDSPRLSAKAVKRIHFLFMSLPGKTKGLAFRTPRLFAEHECGLMIKVTSDYVAPNLTPAHELFHHFQYGYSMYPARWYLEGLARYTENLFRPGATRSSGTIPLSDHEVDNFFSQAYSADDYWKAIADNCRKDTKVEKSTSGREDGIKYLSSKREMKINPDSVNLDFVLEVLKLSATLEYNEVSDENSKNLNRQMSDRKIDDLFLDQILRVCKFR